MTSPPSKIKVQCPTCGRLFEDWYRASINLSLGEEWTKAEIEEATSVKCPRCGTRTPVGSLVVDQSGTFQIDQ